jgi:integrase
MGRAYILELKATLKQSSLVGVRSLLHHYFIYLRANHWSPVNADDLPRIGAPHDDEIRRLHLSDADVAQLFAWLRQRYRADRSCRNARDLFIYALLFGCGLRISEVTALQIGELSMETREVYLATTKTNSSRYVAIPGSVMAFARLYLRYRRACKREEYLFVSNRGGRYSPHTLGIYVKRIAAEAGVAMSSHCGRRFCLTRLAKVNVLAAQQQGGHKRLETTRAYVRPSNEAARRVLREHDPLR